jgi:hypothetical protein
MKKIIALALIISIFIPGQAQAATAKPTLKPTIKSSLAIKKKVVRRTYRRRNVTPLPSPSPKWPPANFVSGGSVYGKVPSVKELQGVLAGAGTSSSLYKDSQTCVTHVCGVLQVASTTACTYWEVDSALYSDSVTKNLLGTLHTYAAGTSAKKIATIYLITPVALQDGYFVGSIKANCWTQTPTEIVPSNNYVANN